LLHARNAAGGDIGDVRRPDEPGGPFDELLLQLAESLRATLGPAGAEIWMAPTGTDPDRQRSRRRRSGSS